MDKKDIENIFNSITNFSDYGLILNCAVRYALGRQSYVTGAVPDFIIPQLPYLDNRTVWCFVNDLEGFDKDVKSGSRIWGMACDETSWKKFWKLCKKEYDKREDLKNG